MVKNKLTVVIDTNVFIYGMNNITHSASSKVLELIKNKRINVIFSQDTFGELIYVMKHWSRRSLDNKKERLELLYGLVDLFYNSLSYDTTQTICPTCNDIYDNMLLRCATEGNADYLITQDFNSGMLELEDFGFKVVTAYEFMKIFK